MTYALFLLSALFPADDQRDSCCCSQHPDHPVHAA